MIKDYNLYESFNNDGLGFCTVLDKCEKGYLIYSMDNSSEHFIVCDEIFEDGYLCNTVYYNNLKSAINGFDYLREKDLSK